MRTTLSSSGAPRALASRAAIEAAASAITNIHSTSVFRVFMIALRQRAVRIMRGTRVPSTDPRLPGFNPSAWQQYTSKSRGSSRHRPAMVA